MQWNVQLSVGKILKRLEADELQQLWRHLENNIELLFQLGKYN